MIAIGAFFFYTNFKEETTPPEEKYDAVNQQGLHLMEESEFLSDSTEGIALMIEFHEDITGLTNYVDMLSARDIPGVLLVSPGYIEDHCENLKKIKKHDIRIGAGINSEALWDVPYEEQLDKMKETKQTFKECFGEELKIFNSRYFAYDENTIKAAEELDIDYVFARGTTGNRATVYQPEEYDVKIFSVSNITSPEYGTGSLCDYSYWARAGEPEEFENKLFDSLKFDQISPVSHTYLGGMKEGWNEAYLNFFNEAEVNWQTWQEFTAAPDLTLPFSEIPQNREVQYTEPKPKEPLEETENVKNPCRPDDLSEQEGGEPQEEQEQVEEEIVMFHNNKGEMCLEALDFFEENDYEIKEYLTKDPEFSEKLNSFKAEFEKSEGVSEDFGYYPMIFVEGRAFSGFSDEIAQDIKQLMEE